MELPGTLDPDPVVRRILAARAPLRWRGREVPDDLPLGPTGLGLDSVAIVELLLECEETLGIQIPPTLFDAGPVSVGMLIAAVRRGSASIQTT